MNKNKEWVKAEIKEMKEYRKFIKMLNFEQLEQFSFLRNAENNRRNILNKNIGDLK